MDPEDPNTVGYRFDGTPFPLPGIDSINMWGLISGVEKSSPRQEIPHCINHPLYNSSALTVGGECASSLPARAFVLTDDLLRADYKLLLGPQTLAFWQGPAYPNGTDGVPYWGSNNTLDCGNDVTMEGGCLFNIRCVHNLPLPLNLGARC